jgi:hypothetical protein
MNERRRALLLALVACVAAGLVVASMRSTEDPSAQAGAVDPHPARPSRTSSGAVAFEAPRALDALRADASAAPSADAAIALVPLAIDPRAFEAGAARAVPIDPETGKPLEPTRVREGAGSGQPLPRRVLDRGAF